MRGQETFSCKFKQFYQKTVPKQERILIHFLVFSFPKCVNRKILFFLKIFIIKKSPIKKLDFNNLKIKQAKQYKIIKKCSLELHHSFKKLNRQSRCLSLTRDGSIYLEKLYLVRIQKYSNHSNFQFAFFFKFVCKLKIYSILLKLYCCFVKRIKY